MSEESVNCIECNNPMLLRTALKYDGKCIPCFNGYRESIEQSRHYYSEQNKLRDHPSTLHWRLLCSKVDDTKVSFESLTNAEQLYFAVSLLEGEVFNGGFEQYFTNSSADYFPYALTGFAMLGDTVALDLTNRAKAILFGDEEVETDRMLRHLQSERLGHFDETIDLSDVDVHDREFVEHYESVLRRKLLHFAFENKFWGSDKSLYEF